MNPRRTNGAREEHSGLIPLSAFFAYKQVAQLGNVVSSRDACGSYAELHKGSLEELAKYSSLRSDDEEPRSSLFEELTMKVTSFASGGKQPYEASVGDVPAFLYKAYLFYESEIVERNKILNTAFRNSISRTEDILNACIQKSSAYCYES